MSGLSIRHTVGDASGTLRDSTEVQVLPGETAKVRAWHNRVTHATVDLGAAGTVTFTGTPAVLHDLLARLDTAVCSAEVEAEHEPRRWPHVPDEDTPAGGYDHDGEPQVVRRPRSRQPMTFDSVAYSDPVGAQQMRDAGRL